MGWSGAADGLDLGICWCGVSVVHSDCFDGALLQDGILTLKFRILLRDLCDRPPPLLNTPKDMGMTDQPIFTQHKLYKCISVQSHQGTPVATRCVEEEAVQGE